MTSSKRIIGNLHPDKRLDHRFLWRDAIFLCVADGVVGSHNNRIIPIVGIKYRLQPGNRSTFLRTFCR